MRTSIRRFDSAALRATPWKNGGGVTREVIASPHGSGLETFVWRVSMADVSSDGPFSVFEGVDRVLVLLEGNGVVLREGSGSGNGRVVCRLDEPFVPFLFSGDDHITSSLVDGPSVDFNVMTRRASARADVRVVRTSASLALSRAGVLFAARGTWVAEAVDEARAGEAHERLELAAGDGCHWDGEPLAWRVTSDEAGAVLLAVRVQPANLGE